MEVRFPHLLSTMQQLWKDADLPGGVPSVVNGEPVYTDHLAVYGVDGGAHPQMRLPSAQAMLQYAPGNFASRAVQGPGRGERGHTFRVPNAPCSAFGSRQTDCRWSWVLTCYTEQNLGFAWGHLTAFFLFQAL